MARKIAILLLAIAVVACAEAEPRQPPLIAARALLDRGDGLGGEIALRRLLAEGTPREELAAYLGEAELLQGDMRSARTWLDSGDFSAETRGHGFRMLGRLEMAEGNLAAAGAAFDRALQSAPDDPELWVDIGRLRYLGGEQVQAVDASERAVELGPQNAAALAFRGQLVRDAHGMEAALPWFEAALAIAPDDADVLADYAATLGELGRAREMLAVVRKLAAAAPRDPRAPLFQAVLAARAGEFGLAHDILGRRGDPRRTSAAGALMAAVADLEAGNHASAAQTFDRLLRAQPDNRRLRQLLVRALHLAGNDRELVYRFSEEARAASADRYLVQMVGRAYEALGEREMAAPFLERAARKSGTGMAPLRSAIPLDLAETRGVATGSEARALVRASIAAGRLDAAIAGAEAFRNRARGSADALGLAGDAYLAAGQPQRALERYRSAAEIRRPWPLTRRMLAALSTIGNRTEAEWLIASQLASEPANREALAMAAEMAFDAGRTARGEALLDRALMLGGSRDPGLLALAAEAALRTGAREEAEQLAMQAYRLQRRNPAAGRALFQALRAAGKRVAAETVQSDL